MRIAFVLTYPIYHDMWSTEQWLALENRDRWLPGIAASMGHDVELWAVDHRAGTYPSVLPGFGSYTIRLFPHDGGGEQTKTHFSTEMAEYARRFRPDLTVLKGVDGGAGTYLIETYLKPENRRFAILSGGNTYRRHFADAELVFYQTDDERARLEHPGLRFWRRPVASDRLIRMPKGVDTDHFRPLDGIEKEWDVITVCRLAPIKNPAGVGPLSEHLRIAVIGTGPMEAELRAKWPNVAWLGQVQNRDVPELLNKARLFMFPGLREYYPRAIAEAMACGLPCVAFGDVIKPDVLPPSCGIRLPRREYVRPVLDLLNDEARLQAMGRNSREHAVAHSGKYAGKPVLEAMFERLGIPHSMEAFPLAATP